MLLLLMAGSGAAALIYEIVWLQLLELVIGSSAVSIGILLGTFMGGMCLGSLWLPRLVSRRRHPLRVYAVLELGIGGFGMLLLFTMPLVGRVYIAGGADGATGFLFRGAVAAICLFPPTLAMGATLPVLAGWLEATPEGIAMTGFLYAANITGAVFGSLLAGFYLLRAHDMAVATYVAAGINIAAACVAWLVARIDRGREWGSEASVVSGFRRSASGSAPIYIAIALSGFCALAGEVVWTRLLGLLFGATVYTFSIILAVFLVGLGAGSSAGSALSRRVAPRAALGWCQMLLVAAIAWTAHEVNASLPYWPINPTLSTSNALDFELDIVRTLWAVLPPALLWGASFPLALAAVARRVPDASRVVGSVYAANTVGAVAGALVSSLLLIAWIGSQHAQQIMLAMSAASGLLLLLPLIISPSGNDTRRRGPMTAAIAVALAMTAWLVKSVPPVPGLLVAHGRFAPTFLNQAVDIIYMGEGLQSSVAVSRFPDGKLGYHNAGKIQASSAPQDMRLQRLLGHVTTLVPAVPRSVLVIGCGAGVTAGAVSIDPMVERVTIAEIEPLVPRVVSKYFGAQNFNVIGNPKVHLRIDDARHYLLTTKETFDAITSDPLDPWVKGAATLYTKEFFEAAKSHLNPGGVVTVFVQLYDSSPAAVKSEMATFFDVFPNGIVAGNTFHGVGYDTVLLGQADPIRIDLDAIEERMRRPAYAAVVTSLQDVGIASTVDLFASYAGRAADLSAWLRGAAINRDGNLRLQYLAGLGLNMNESDAMYAEMLKYRRYPDGLFIGSDVLTARLRERIGD